MYYITLTRYSSLSQVDPDPKPLEPSEDWTVTLPIIGLDDSPELVGETFTFMSGRQAREPRMREGLSLELWPFSNIPGVGEWDWDDFKALKTFLSGAYVEVVSCTLPRTDDGNAPTGRFTLQGLSTSRNNAAANTGVRIELSRSELGVY